MKQTITYERLAPDTVRGDVILIKQVMSSFDRQEIDALEQTLSRTIGTAIITEFDGKDQNGNN